MTSMYDLMEPYIFSAATRPGEPDIFALTLEQLQIVANALLAAAPPDAAASMQRVLEAADNLHERVNELFDAEPGEENWTPAHFAMNEYEAAVSALRAREGQG